MKTVILYFLITQHLHMYCYGNVDPICPQNPNCVGRTESPTSSCLIGGKPCMAFNGMECKKELNKEDPAATVEFSQNSSITITKSSDQICLQGFQQRYKKEKIGTLEGIYVEAYLLRMGREVGLTNGEFMLYKPLSIKNSKCMLSSWTICLKFPNLPLSLEELHKDPSVLMALQIIPLPPSFTEPSISFPGSPFRLNSLLLSEQKTEPGIRGKEIEELRERLNEYSTEIEELRERLNEYKRRTNGLYIPLLALFAVENFFIILFFCSKAVKRLVPDNYAPIWQNESQDLGSSQKETSF